ncbi:MAG: hypothetical protein ACOX67_02615 [Oscillospiraceae bacterium]|jgi:hypothetical protein
MENPRTTMIARVLRVERASLLVCDCSTEQEVVVHTGRARCFSFGDCVCIRYNGIMALSMPPQITASCIEKHRPCR